MTTEGETGSAPSKVDALQPRWEQLSVEQRQVFAYRWIDRSVRELLPHTFERNGRLMLAAVTRGLAPIASEDDVEAAYEFLKSRFDASQGDHPVLMLAAVFSAMAFLRKPVTIEESAFMAFMTSRLVFGDDRVQASLEADLAAAAAG